MKGNISKVTTESAASEQYIDNSVEKVLSDASKARADAAEAKLIAEDASNRADGVGEALEKATNVEEVLSQIASSLDYILYSQENSKDVIIGTLIPDIPSDDVAQSHQE